MPLGCTLFTKYNVAFTTMDQISQDIHIVKNMSYTVCTLANKTIFLDNHSLTISSTNEMHSLTPRSISRFAEELHKLASKND